MSPVLCLCYAQRDTNSSHLQLKSTYAHEDAITDDVAGQAYIEQFAQETLDRAERVVKANKVTQQTATTFDAAATFFHLVNIWGPPDQETQQKIKYAKWNANRIAKAIKEGKDPNESNPKLEEPQQQPSLDPNDPEVQRLGGTTPGLGHLHLQPKVEDVSDSDTKSVRRDAAGVSLPHSPASTGPSDELSLPGVPTHIGGSLPPPQQPGYFDNSMPSPVSPQPPAHNPVNHHPSAPPPQTWAPTPPAATAFSPPPPSAPEDHHRSAPTPPVPGPEDLYRPIPPPAAPPTFAPSQPPTAAVAPPTPVASIARPPVPAATAPRPTGTFTTDEAAMVQAQKHAKWAISALNFEDVNTAVMELRRALQTLGAS